MGFGTKPASIAAYREVTASHKTMAGVTSHTFLCKKCKQYKSVTGRSRIDKHNLKAGYICRYCKETDNEL